MFIVFRMLVFPLVCDLVVWFNLVSVCLWLVGFVLGFVFAAVAWCFW